MLTQPKTPKTGDEPMHANGTGLGFCLLDFWRWSASDLISNATRGRLAEFIVAKALAISTDGVRDEWAAYDLTTPEGMRIEVKSAAYLQSWSHERFSSIRFSTRRSRAWDSLTGLYASEAIRQADVYVFALLAHREPATLDPMNVNQWKFYVVPTSKLDHDDRSQHSITLKSLERLCGDALAYQSLRDAVLRAAPEHVKHQRAAGTAISLTGNSGLTEATRAVAARRLT